MTTLANYANLTPIFVMHNTGFKTRMSLITATKEGQRREEFARVYEPFIRYIVERKSFRLGLSVVDVDAVVQTSLVRLLYQLTPSQLERPPADHSDTLPLGGGVKSSPQVEVANQPGHIGKYKRFGEDKENRFSVWLAMCLEGWIRDFVRQYRNHEARTESVDRTGDDDEPLQTVAELTVPPPSLSHAAELLQMVIYRMRESGELEESDLGLLADVADGFTFEELARREIRQGSSESVEDYENRLERKIGALRFRKFAIATKIKKAFRAMETLGSEQ